MPIYEYRCEECGAAFEELTLSSSQAEAPRCRHCASPRVNRLLSAFAVHGTARPDPVELGPCGACGAAQRGACGVE